MSLRTRNILAMDTRASGSPNHQVLGGELSLVTLEWPSFSSSQEMPLVQDRHGRVLVEHIGHQRQYAWGDDRCSDFVGVGTPHFLWF